MTEPRTRRWREPLVVCLLGLVMACVMNWPLPLALGEKVPSDLGDPLAQSWTLAWSGHAVSSGAPLWDGNVFFPHKDSYAYTDSLLGYLPVSLISSGDQAALIRYNVVFLLAAALVFIGAYALVRQLGATWVGAGFAAIAVAYAPWRLAHAGHLNVMSSGGIFVCLWLLAHGHGFSLTRGFRAEEARPWIAAVGWAVAAWQITLGFAIGIPFGYALMAVLLAGGIGWLVAGRPEVPPALLAANFLGFVSFAVVTVLMARPYWRILERDPDAERSKETLELFEVPASGLITAPDTSLLWGDEQTELRGELSWPAEMALLPGAMLLILAVVGLFFSAWTVRARLVLAVLVAVSAILAMGTAFHDGTYSYLLLYDNLPGFNALRTPGRLILWTTLFLAVLAAGTLTKLGGYLADLVRQRSGSALATLSVFVAIVPLLVAVAEGYAVRPYPEVPPIPPTLAKEFRSDHGPFTVLPASGSLNFRVQYWSTTEFPQLTNGEAGYYPPSAVEIGQGRLAAFPEFHTVAYLRDLGVHTVIVLKGEVGSADILARDASAAGVMRIEHEDAVVYRLS